MAASIEGGARRTDDAVSAKVAAQYEAHPYPRWTSLFMCAPGTDICLEPRSAVTLRGRLLALQRANVPEEKKQAGENGNEDDDDDYSSVGHVEAYLPPFENATVLSAGCGTGRGVIADALANPGARFVGVDFSTASLAYARTMQRAFNLSNVRFRHSDILRLGEPAPGARAAPTYDVIECSGVLHHMRDPEQGLAVLRGLLKPRGAMRLALYSGGARSRAGVSAARSFALSAGLDGRKRRDIRRFREMVMAMHDGRPAALSAPKGGGAFKNLWFGDFHACSDVRDTVFHAHEVGFTIPEIEALLARQRMRFLGFEVGPNIRQLFAEFLIAEAQKGNPSVRAVGKAHLVAQLQSLERWHAFEKQHPMAFGSMYQFWAGAEDGNPQRGEVK